MKGYLDPLLAQGNCAKVVDEMIKEFSELKKVGGVVFSYKNPDNFDNCIKEYPHVWCIDQNKNIIDPTVSQFNLLGKLEYKELDLTKQHYKCMGCGSWSTKRGYCGECEWSE